jgi:hypothetical protein
MTITIDPSIEACQALVARINAGTYGTSVTAEYREEQIDPLENVSGKLLATVVPIDEEQLNETLGDDRTSHSIRVYIRKKLTGDDPADIDILKLTARKIWSQLNNYDTTDKRVCVWECDQDSKQKPDKDALKERGVFLASINMRVEVGAS